MTDKTKTEENAAPAIMFRVREGRKDYKAFVVNVLNALNASGSAIVAGTMEDAAFAAFVAQFATDEGTTVLREDAAATALRGAIDRTSKSLKRKVRFSPIETHNGEDWIVAGYRVTETK